ncbi:hypothetical protein BAUCODRAFT_333311 [Baudoinia panamericana UAMH 10762]|uniref:Uncharacterized protein n=1 Tax=Baudoinia panamericana (strain UAMH 10762) TaxID=717646 RepID=M2LB42_BAUPA|nr:uncharacterized protein BAUCODRAFT_333311 [Baudoinia panamericana UAMH 10762]EMC91032.1 hypothetical protein BAUCODRAFT_333311 [Baudoinia panamericana UAMH 10762]
MPSPPPPEYVPQRGAPLPQRGAPLPQRGAPLPSKVIHRPSEVPHCPTAPGWCSSNPPAYMRTDQPLQAPCKDPYGLHYCSRIGHSTMDLCQQFQESAMFKRYSGAAGVQSQLNCRRAGLDCASYEHVMAASLVPFASSQLKPLIRAACMTQRIVVLFCERMATSSSCSLSSEAWSGWLMPRRRCCGSATFHRRALEREALALFFEPS